MTQADLKQTSIEDIVKGGPDAIAEAKRLLNEAQKKAKASAVEVDHEIDPTLDLLINNFGWDRLWNRALVKRKTHKPVATGKAKKVKAPSPVDALKNLGIKAA
jgi:hypothetical protein